MLIFIPYLKHHKKGRIKGNPPNLKYFHFSFAGVVCLCLTTDVTFTVVQSWFSLYRCDLLDHKSVTTFGISTNRCPL